MRTSGGSSAITRLTGVVAALWLWGASAAWAGGGGMDAGFLQANLLNPLCNLLGMISCPQLPTVSQILIETSALENVAPNFIRGQIIPLLGTSSDTCTVAGNFGFDVCDKVAISAVNRPLPFPVSSADLFSLTPLGFTVSGGQAIPVPPGPENGATTLFYAAVATRANGQPDMLNLLYDYPALTKQSFTQGQIVAEISLPLEVLSTTDGSERLVCGAQGCPQSVATMVVTADCTGGPSCLTAKVIGDFTKAGVIDPRPPAAAALGIKFSLIFGQSPNFSTPHTIFYVQAPLLVTGPTKASWTNCGVAIEGGMSDTADCGNDPAYFGVTPAFPTNGNKAGYPTGVNQASGLPTAFSPFSSSDTVPVGIAPYAAPGCPGGSCDPNNPPMTTFPFCASFLANNGGTGVQSAVAAFLAIGTDSTTYVSAPVPPVSTPAPHCPF